MSVFCHKIAVPGLIGQDKKKTSRDGGGSDLGELYQAGPGTPGCKGTPEPQPKCAIAHGRGRDTLMSWQQPEKWIPSQIQRKLLERKKSGTEDPSGQ